MLSPHTSKVSTGYTDTKCSRPANEVQRFLSYVSHACGRMQAWERFDGHCGNSDQVASAGQSGLPGGALQPGASVYNVVSVSEPVSTRSRCFCPAGPSHSATCPVLADRSVFTHEYTRGAASIEKCRSAVHIQVIVKKVKQCWSQNTNVLGD
jgi:hypothetical protein